MKSLKSRLLGSSIFVLLIFVIIIGLLLDRANVAKSKAHINLGLQSQIYDLERDAKLTRNGELALPEQLNQLQLMQPMSGHYAAVAKDGEIIWQSKSNLGIKLPYITKLKPGQRKFKTVKAEDGSDLFLLSLGYVWVDENDNPLLFIFNVALSARTYQQELLSYRHTLLLSLGSIVLLYLIIQSIILAWSLKPLVRVRENLSEIEQGTRDYLDSNYISEIKDLTADFNTLMRFERARQERYKNSLGDLAHSFKTPLAVIKATTNSAEIDNKTQRVLTEQVIALDELVTYQLKRAQTLGSRASLAKPVYLNQTINKVTGALLKVYSDKNVKLSQNIDDNSVFYGEEGDILEVLGNLLDNAFKWCQNKVKITANIEELGNATALTIIVEDDGRGIDDTQKQLILKRGVRADEQTPGHGIRMSILTEIIEAYCGELNVEDSDLGGAKFIVKFKH